MAETSFVKDRILPFIPENCCGIDVGFGNDKIREDFIGADQEHPYSGGKNYKIDLVCDISKGIPVPESTYDVVYSSHLIEDFVDTKAILMEFIRICKDGGRIILVFPDQQKYELKCQRNNENPNPSHKIKEMGIKYMLNELNAFDNITIVDSFEIPSYNCIVVFDIMK